MQHELRKFFNRFFNPFREAKDSSTVIRKNSNLHGVAFLLAYFRKLGKSRAELWPREI